MMTDMAQRPQPRLVLVVDDQEINRDALGIILEEKGYETLYAENGEEALSAIRKHRGELSLVMLDLMMPVKNGFEVLDEMQAESRLRKIPVIVLTADKSAELLALQKGAADFITKPFDMPEIILARVERIIELSEGRRLISAAEQDQLTGLYTRNFFYEYAENFWKFHPDRHLDALALNIEQFHVLNAVNGYEFGDRVLRTLGEEIRAFLAEREGIAGRFDADAFEIYCPEQPDYAAVLGRFQERLNSAFKNVDIRLRMGVMPWQAGVEPIRLFDRARVACAMVRGNYQHPLMIHDEEMRKKELLNQRLLNDLNAAIEEEQLRVYFQPKYDIQRDPPRMVSAEALVRWVHPELGMISPGVFIPLLEGNGLITRLDHFVWRKTAEQIASWRKRCGFAVPVSVNLSRADVFDRSLEERLTRLIQENGLTFRDLKLEVTESAYTDNARELLDTVRSLREKGFEIEMDDFGSGYSSLNMLSEMPIDVLKMDMKFIRNIEQKKTDRQLVRLVLDIARSLKLRVVAEGVETEGQLAFLKKRGCDLVQGYYFSRPLPAEEFEKLMMREKEEET
ncbi:MAG: EAL domain-containing protein [Clostridia bacterium]|nr:EAL domain-containing protein [Clostridia bacterium]